MPSPDADAPGFAIRAYRAQDCDGCATCFARSVREGAARHYSPAQRAAWAPDRDGPPGPGFCAGLEAGQTVVATCAGDIIGFMSMHDDGYLDFAFVLPGWMGRGVAQALYERIAEWARLQGLTCLKTHASHFARPFLARNGWILNHAETVQRGGQSLERFAMSLTMEETR